jgi:putative DNA primase/helicase
MGLAFAVATGGTFLRWTTARPRKVLYLDGELPGAVMQSRVLLHLPESEPTAGFFRVFTPDLLGMDDTLPDIATRDGQEIINEMIEDDTALVVLDNLSAWARGNRAENDAESWLPIADWALALRRRGIAVLIVHHAGKGGDQRGTSKREDLLDAVLRLDRPSDYEPREGARFSVTVTKARHLHGDDAEGLEVTMHTNSDRATWEWMKSEDDTYRRVTELAREGLSQAEIAAELGKHRSTVSRHLKHAKTAFTP